MQASENAYNLIKLFEGFRSKRYICPSGFYTIGYGTLWKEGMPEVITKEQAEEYLKKEVEKICKSIKRLIKVPLTQNQFDALVDFCYNLGTGSLQRSTLRMKLNRKEYVDASNEFLKWVWAGGRKLRGLIRRREAERKLFLSYIKIQEGGK